jgi:predicted TIM-barrel fold metal-dependent hydrolase
MFQIETLSQQLRQLNNDFGHPHSLLRVAVNTSSSVWALGLQSFKDMRHFIGLTLIAISITPLVAAAQAIPLDVHVHNEYLSDEVNGADLFLGQTLVSRALLISASYAIDKNKTSDGHDWVSDLSLRKTLDLKTQQLVAQHSERLRGLCGFNPNWKDGSDIVNTCLSRPLMVGIKIHSEDSHYTFHKNEDVVRPLLKSLQKKNLLVLWHIGQIENIEQFYRLSRDFPSVTFIFAHSMYSPDYIREWVDLEKQQGQRSNVYLEISTNWNNGPREMNKDYVEAWRAFGFHRVLFGTDSGFLQKEELGQFTQTFLRTSDITVKEKDLMLKTAAGKIMKLVGF